MKTAAAFIKIVLAAMILLLILVVYSGYKYIRSSQQPANKPVQTDQSTELTSKEKNSKASTQLKQQSKAANTPAQKSSSARINSKQKEEKADSKTKGKTKAKSKTNRVLTGQAIEGKNQQPAAKEKADHQPESTPAQVPEVNQSQSQFQIDAPAVPAAPVVKAPETITSK